MSSRRFAVTCLSLVFLLLVGAWALTAAPPSSRGLEYLGKLEISGFSLDGLGYDPRGPRLLATSGASLFELTLEGQLLAQYPLSDYVGGDIARATSGPKAGHFFVTGSPALGVVRVQELDRDLQPIGLFEVGVDGQGNPGDGVAFNHFRRTLLVTDQWGNLLHEITTDGQWIRSMESPCCASAAGITYNSSTGTYFGVNHSSSELTEFDGTTNVIRSFDLGAFGVQQPIGVTYGQGKLYVADELDPPYTDTGGFIHVFRSPKPAR